MDAFKHMKQWVIARQMKFTENAVGLLKTEHLLPEMVFEAAWNASSIYKTMRSKNSYQVFSRNKLLARDLHSSTRIQNFLQETILEHKISEKPC